MNGTRHSLPYFGWLHALAVLLFLYAPQAQSAQLTVFAAASLKNALDEVAAEFDHQTGHQTVVSYAGSSALARQIELGAPADVFISANPDWVDYLTEQGVLEGGQRIDLLGNQLVLIAHTPQTLPEWADLNMPEILGENRLAMAMVQSVPAGIYGKAALQSLGQWEAIAAQVAQTDNVRAALALVALGEAPFGIVYKTDALADPRVHIAATIPTNSHPAIRYPAITTHGGEPGGQFLTYLQGPNAQRIFERHGFSVLVD